MLSNRSCFEGKDKAYKYGRSSAGPANALTTNSSIYCQFMTLPDSHTFLKHSVLDVLY